MRKNTRPANQLTALYVACSWLQGSNTAYVLFSSGLFYFLDVPTISENLAQASMLSIH